MSSEKTTTVENSVFVSRLVELFGTRKPAEIGRKLNIDYQTAKNYLGGRKPNAEVLEKIVEVTDVSLNWLLMGQGPKFLREEFDVERAVALNDDWFEVMTDWYKFEKRSMPSDGTGVSFMGGWKSLGSSAEKAKAIRDLKTLWDLAQVRTDDIDDTDE